jgi:cytochrome c553
MNRFTLRYRRAKWLLLALLLLLMLMLMTGTSMASPSVQKGEAISGQCAACHGTDGKAVNTSYPNLAAQNYQYLVDQLKKFKTGERQNSIMQALASGLSDEQIEDLSAYYASLKTACSQ